MTRAIDEQEVAAALQRTMARLHCAPIGRIRNKEGSMNEQIQPSKGAPLFNPWSSEFIANPYPSYHLLRETEPMHYMPLGLYVASRHADITTILRDKRFGKDFIGRMTRRAGPQILEEPVYRSMSHWMLQLDPPDHGRLRGLVVRAFSARRIEDMRPRIHGIVDDIIRVPAGIGRSGSQALSLIINIGQDWLHSWSSASSPSLAIRGP